MAALGLPVRKLPANDSPRTAIVIDWQAWVPAAILWVAALLLVVRRLDGALRIPLSFGGAAMCGLALAVAAAGCRFAARRADDDSTSRRGRLLRAAGAIAAVAAAAALSLGGTSAEALVALWLPIALGELARFGPWERGARGGDWSEFVARPASSRRLCQQVTRFIDAAGREVVEGTAVARFAPGQRTTSIHLAFCPPLARTPEIACRAAADVAAEVKVAQCVAYAARFDVKLAAVAAVPLEVPVSFSARCPTS
jgi:hypothetical protein